MKKKVQENVIVKEDNMVSEHEYLFGQKKQKSKIIDVKSGNDFPDLSGETLEMG